MLRDTITRRRFLKAGVGAAATLPIMRAATSAAASNERPNILWLTCEDIGPHLGCYGDEYADSPNIDALAVISLRYDMAWSNAPVCAPARTTIISGAYATSVGGQHMRSMAEIPEFMQMYPQFLREAGYYCTNNRKEDYNLRPHGDVWDESSGEAHWRNRAEGQPFFAIFNFTESHEGRIRSRPHELRRDKDEAPVPPYHPDTPETRHDWAQYYDTIEDMDERVGERLAEIEEAGLMDDTIIFFYSDHGSGMPRHKRWPYNSGLHVPLIVYVPEKYRHLAPADYQPGATSDRLTSFVDLAPTLLSLAGVQPPDWMQGRAYMGEYEDDPQQYLYGFRGRMDERIDMVRSVCDGRYVYIRNYMPHLIYGQHLNYMWQTPTTEVWEALYKAGELEPPQTYFWEPKPPEELYDLENDPHEVDNLADSEAHAEKLNELREALRGHVLDVCDAGFLPEAEMHRRAGDTSIYEMAHDPERYPLERIHAMAEKAANRDEAAVPELVEAFGDEDPAIRYWAMMGVLVRGEAGFEAAAETAREALNDENPSVRIVAAQVLGEHGDDADLDSALDTLAELAPPDRNGAYVAIAAVNAIDGLGEKADRLEDLLAEMPVEDPNAPSRANDYVHRLTPSE